MKSPRGIIMDTIPPELLPAFAADPAAACVLSGVCRRFAAAVSVRLFTRMRVVKYISLAPFYPSSHSYDCVYSDWYRLHCKFTDTHQCYDCIAGVSAPEHIGYDEIIAREPARIAIHNESNNVLINPGWLWHVPGFTRFYFDFATSGASASNEGVYSRPHMGIGSDAVVVTDGRHTDWYLKKCDYRAAVGSLEGAHFRALIYKRVD